MKLFNSVKALKVLLILFCLAALSATKSFSQTSGTTLVPEWRRSDWATVRPNDGVSLNRHTAGEDWWYGHCNAYNEGEFVGYMCVGFGRPIENWPNTPDDCYNPFENQPSIYEECDGQGYHAIGLIDKSGTSTLMYKLINNSYEELFNVIQTSDGNFVAVGFNPGNKDVNGNGLIYNPRTNGDNISFYGVGNCNDAVSKKYHAYVIKFDIEGNIIWQYLYGEYDPENESLAEIDKARYSASIAYDLVEVSSDRIRIVGTEETKYNGNEETDFIDENFYSRAFILDIDNNGQVLSRYEIPDSRFYPQELFTIGSYGYAIDKLQTLNGEDKFVLSGNVNYGFNASEPSEGACIGIGSFWGVDNLKITLMSFADVFEFSNGQYTPVWNNPFLFKGTTSNVRKRTKSYDVKTMTDGRICLSSIALNVGCGFSGENRGTGYLHLLDPIDGALDNVVEIETPLAAFDLKMGIASLPEGGFAIVSTTQKDAPFLETELEPSSPCYTVGRGYVPQITNTDAYVARFNSDGSIIWETIFNVTDQTESTADDPKQQECMYTITVCPDDGSLVMAGNNSYNMDDSYLVKMKSDCNFTQNYDVDKVDTDPLNINESTTWNSSMKIRGPVFVKSGATLTIEGENTIIEFADYRDDARRYTRLEVEPGATLIVNDAKLTSLQSCPNSTWRGIFLRGDGTRNQFANQNGVLFQGKFIGNNCTIENSEEGIEAINEDGWRSGGIIQAKSCKFLNNTRSISFQSYHNILNSGTEVANQSYFNKCQFLIDRPLIKGNLPSSFVTMWDVKGIRFLGCKFENANPQAQEEEDLGGAGIYSIDADYSISSVCDQILAIGQTCDPEFYTKSEFVNLRVGIRAQKTSGTSRFTVGDSDFRDCIYGIYNEGHDYVIANGNSILEGNNITQPFFNIGLLNLTGTKYRFEYNSFNSPVSTESSFSIGSIIVNSGLLSNEVYKNNFSDLFVANLALGQNRNNNPSGDATFSGLEYRCNSMQNNRFDIAVMGSDKFSGINTYQGVLNGNKIDAGNTFSHNGNPETDIFNSSWNPIIYIYNPNEIDKEPLFTSSSVFTTPISGPYNTCPDRFGRFTLRKRLSTSESTSFNTVATQYSQTLNTLKSNYTSLIDGGSSEERIAELNLATQFDENEMRTHLMNLSPYLSSDVLLKAAEKNNVLSNQALLEILISNPDGMRGEELKQYLSDKNDPFPEEWIEFLASQDGLITYRTALEFLLSASQKDFESVCDILVSDALLIDDENGIDFQKLHNTLDLTSPSLHGDFILFDVLIDEGDYSNANSLLNDIPLRNRLTNEQLAEYIDFKSLGEIVINIRTNNLTNKQLDAEQMANLRSISDNGVLIPNLRAKNWLSLITGDLDWYHPELPGVNQAKKMKKTVEKPASLKEFSVNPNPASDYFFINSNGKIPMNTSLEIFDGLGKLQYSANLGTFTSQRIDIGGLVDGIYLLQFTQPEGIIQVEKLVVKK